MSITTLLKTKYPLIQGGMANIATAEFAASVANAGALGLIGAGGMNASRLREEIRRAKELTEGSFGVNLMLMNPEVDEMADIVVEEGVRFVTTGAGNPGKYMAKWKEAGIVVMPVVPSVALAKRMERLGADALIVEGCEAGGHIGELTTMALVPQVAQAVSIPVIAAGGIASNRQIAASFCLGAVGVQVGTCLLASQECPIHENYKQAVLKAKDTDTIVTGRIGGTPVRILKNKMAKQYVAKEKEGASREELEVYTLGSLRKAVFEGNVDEGSLMAGQVSGMVHEIRPVAKIIAELFEGVDHVLEEAKDVYNNSK
ncbi:MAG TPA: DUF561 domain-containing protein [Candidatus Fimiplasma intestinipullorum]|uniref:Probable nitronate monooxygenase n=1 Tax=Candidatus Fimiplasma intestinipullorum TaxID=2840825 RepID=A0A9D1HP31_9FIRM|nr:DUF561 domain-containing protein [Candidatus Fimiplasma intestinipullorum]